MGSPSERFTILALVTTWDASAAAVVRGGRTVLASVRGSKGALPAMIKGALGAVQGGWSAIDAIAAPTGPGLTGALRPALSTAKTLAGQRKLPFHGIDRRAARPYEGWLVAAPDEQGPAREFPLVALVVTGSETSLRLMRGHGDSELIGQTRDDAAGEAFEKIAHMLGLGTPGGPAIERSAQGATSALTLPRSSLRGSFDFSFSDLKTAVLHRVQERQQLAARMPQAPEGRGGSRPQGPEPAIPTTPAPLDRVFVGQVAHAVQEALVELLVAKTVEAAARHGARGVLLAGGVAANQRLRGELAQRSPVPVHCPPLAHCGDDAAAVAAAAFWGLTSGREGA